MCVHVYVSCVYKIACIPEFSQRRARTLVQVDRLWVELKQ